MKKDLHENFEDFIKRNADNLRMKAPDRVWQNLSGELKKGRRRFGTGLSIFFLITSVLGYYTISNTKHPLRLTPGSIESEQTSAAAQRELGSDANTAVIEKAPIVFTPKERIRREQLLNSINYLTVKRASDAERKSTTTLESSNAQPTFTPTVVDSYPDITNETPTASPQPKASLTPASPVASPWTIESVMNAFLEKQKTKKRRFQTQFHFAPTISYRKLTENKSYLRNTQQAFTQPNFSALYNSVNSMVTHKPDIGFELGVTEKYSLSKNVRVRAGLQFNVNRYDIKAFHAPIALATITLNNRRTARVDSLYTLSNYSNVDVSRNNKGSWLQNFSFQVSAPIGVELALKGNEKMQFGIATTVQPTYVLGDRTYMITSDYKSYTQVPWLLRRWNVNTALETFVTYQSGKTRWQVGPQVRYQLLSSFISNYPVKENLFDFGLRVGVSINK